MPLATRLARLIALAALVAGPALAQTTYTVTFNAGAFAYNIDGVQQPTLTLQRGQTYIFQLQNIPSIHPFYISTSSTGGGAGVWSEGVTGNSSTGNATVIFAVPASAPNQLFYQCGVHSGMGGGLTIGGTSSTETPPDGATLALVLRSANPAAETARAALLLRAAGEARVTLHDATGRLVATLFDGPASAGATTLDVPTNGLAAGVYVLTAEAAGATATRAITVVR